VAPPAVDTLVTSEPVVPMPLVLPDGDVGEETYASLIAKLIGGLTLVVLLAWGGVYLLRRLGLAQPVGATGGPIRLGQRVHLGPKKLICLVEIGDRTLALGVTEQSISILAEWRAGELPVQSPGQGEPRPVTGFAAQLRGLLGQRPPATGRRDGGQG
jgi:flagellar biogenesis protein FliO